mgnify:CR=1 FL=1
MEGEEGQAVGEGDGNSTSGAAPPMPRCTSPEGRPLAPFCSSISTRAAKAAATAAAATTANAANADADAATCYPALAAVSRCHSLAAALRKVELALGSVQEEARLWGREAGALAIRIRIPQARDGIAHGDGIQAGHA